MILKKYKKIVIKIGSSTIINQSSEKLKTNWLKSICKDIFDLHNAGKKITIVSSGAIALGKKVISNNKLIQRLEDKQAAAAIGQIELAKHWQLGLRKHKINSAQLLLTLNDSEERRRYLNARKTITSLQNKIEIIALSKADLIRQDYKDLKTIVKNKTGKVPFIFSNLTKNGIDDLIKELFDRCIK